MRTTSTALVEVIPKPHQLQSALSYFFLCSLRPLRQIFFLSEFLRWILPGLSIVPLPAIAQTGQGLKSFQIEVEPSSLGSNGTWVDRKLSLIADSGSIMVTEDYASRADDRIRIPYLRLHATDTAVYPPVVWLSGGPGQTNMRSFRYDAFIDSSDHIMIGYRGVDSDVSLDCPEVVEVLEGAGDILDTAVIRQVAQGYGACAERLKRSSVDVRRYTAVNVAHDIEATRAALSIDKITLVAESFGTRIAYYYAVLYPERIHRMVLMGANPPGRMVWDPRQSDSLLMRYGELWKLDSGAHRRSGDLIADIRKVHADFPKRWLFFPIYEGTVKATMNSLLFHRGSAAQGFDAYVAAAQGDASGLWMMSFVGGRIFPDVVNWGDNASKAMSADFDPSRDYYHELMPQGSVLGAPLGAFLWSAGQSGRWPVEMIPARFRSVEECSTETLILSGSLDFSTPADNAERELIPRFPRGRHVVMSEAGHIADLWRLQPEATSHLLRTFVRTGRVDATRVEVVPMVFAVSWGFPVLAKLIVGGIALFVIAVAFGVWSGVRRWKKRRHRITQQ